MCCVALAAGCGSGSVQSNGTCNGPTDCPGNQQCIDQRCVGRGGDGGLDGDGLGFGDGGCPIALQCGGQCCGAGQVCDGKKCVQAKGCGGDEDCDNDSYCENGSCTPWGSGSRGDADPACTVVQPIGLFSPVRQCDWQAPPAGDKYPSHKNVLGTPMVVDFDFDADKKVKKPSIVFVSYDGTDGGGEASQCDNGFFGVVRVIDGATCAQQFTVDMAKVRASSPLAVGDLDRDGRPEIVAARCGGGLVAFTYDPALRDFKLLWTSNPANYGASGGGWAGPAIHDLDDDGKPEILWWGTIWDNKGALLDSTLGALSYSSGALAVAADLDSDGKPELVDGAGVYTFDKTTRKWGAATGTGQPKGHVAVADFGTFGASAANDDRSKLDGVAEIAVVSSGAVRVQTLDGRVVYGPVAIPSGGTGGPPTVGDFDNDGRVEIAAAGADSYSVFDPDCSGTPTQATCKSMATNGILWSKVSQDHSSSVTGSSLFDFDGDGATEAVYADECFTRIYHGATGEVLFSQWRSSCTWYENPIVADVDGDFNAELVVPSNTNCATDCVSNPNHPKHPTTGVTMDPLFKGLRCKAAADCPGGGCDAGFCRCQSDAECGNTKGLVCGPPVSGTPGSGDVCRAAYQGKVSGILVYRDALDRWVSSRMIWNQHAYAVTHVNEDGTIPRTSAWKPNWSTKGLNNFRQNVQGDRSPDASPDVTSRRDGQPACDAQGQLTLAVQICNRGSQPLGAGLPVSFYEGSPSGTRICTSATTQQLDPGKCEKVTCLWKSPPTSSPVDVHVRADDDGTGKSTASECKEGNNSTVIHEVRCNSIG